MCFSGEESENECSVLGNEHHQEDGPCGHRLTEGAAQPSLALVGQAKEEHIHEKCEQAEEDAVLGVLVGATFTFRLKNATKHSIIIIYLTYRILLF